jgi:hypothetical protein
MNGEITMRLVDKRLYTSDHRHVAAMLTGGDALEIDSSASASWVGKAVLAAFQAQRQTQDRRDLWRRRW